MVQSQCRYKKNFEISVLSKPRTVFDSGPLYKFSKIGYGNMGSVKESALKCFIKYRQVCFPKRACILEIDKSIQNNLKLCEFCLQILLCISRIQALLGKQTQRYLIKHFKVHYLTEPLLPYPIFQNQGPIDREEQSRCIFTFFHNHHTTQAISNSFSVPRIFPRVANFCGNL